MSDSDEAEGCGCGCGIAVVFFLAGMIAGPMVGRLFRWLYP